MKKIRWLSEIREEDKPFVGEKSFILSQFLQQGYPVIPGFILDSYWFKRLLRKIDISQALTEHNISSFLDIDLNNYKNLQSIVKATRQIILDSQFIEEDIDRIFNATKKLNSPTLIIRPCSIAESIKENLLKLNLKDNIIPESYSPNLTKSVTCKSDRDAITIAIKKIIAQLFNAKNIFYWHKLGIDITNVARSILIQPLENVTASGTVTISDNIIIIEATYGLGHSLTKGEVKPDIYKVNLDSETILDKTLGIKTLGYRPLDSIQLNEAISIYNLEESEQNKLVLTEELLIQLVRLIKDSIETQPKIVNIEWTLPQDKSQFYFTQFNYGSSFSLPQKELSLSNNLIQGDGVSSGIVIGMVTVVKKLHNSWEQILPNSILVTEKIELHQLAIFKHLAAIITEKEGNNTHAAIIARELGIPAIVALKNATEILQTGETVMVDGDTGRVHRQFQNKSNPITNTQKDTLTEWNIDRPIGTQLMVNCSQCSQIEKIASLPIDGVGLLRSDFMLMELLSGQTLPQWLESHSKSELLEYLVNSIRKFAKAFNPRPVFYRSNESIYLHDLDSNLNSLLGIKGTYSYTIDSSFFDLELAALEKVIQEGYNNIKLILPFVRSKDEFVFCRHKVRDFGLTNYSSFQLWIMAEVPSIIFLLPEYIKAGVEGILIGTNDLTQLLFGIDRQQTDFRNLYTRKDILALEKAIVTLITTAKEYNIPCSISLHGEIPHNHFIDKLIRWGITTISVETQQIESIYRKIIRGEQRLLLEAASKTVTTDFIK